MKKIILIAATAVLSFIAPNRANAQFISFTISTDSVTSVTATSATLGMTSGQTDTVTTGWKLVIANQFTTFVGIATEFASFSTSRTLNVPNLITNVPYSAQAFMVKPLDTLIGPDTLWALEVMSFIPQNVIVTTSPTVTVTAVTSGYHAISTSSAFNCGSAGSGTIEIQYSTNASFFPYSVNSIHAVSGNGVDTVTITGLLSNTQYWVRSIITTNTGSDTNDVQITTSMLPNSTPSLAIVTIQVVSANMQNGILVNGTVVSNADSVWFILQASQDQTFMSVSQFGSITYTFHNPTPGATHTYTFSQAFGTAVVPSTYYFNGLVIDFSNMIVASDTLTAIVAPPFSPTAPTATLSLPVVASVTNGITLTGTTYSNADSVDVWFELTQDSSWVNQIQFPAVVTTFYNTGVPQGTQSARVMNQSFTPAPAGRYHGRIAMDDHHNGVQYSNVIHFTVAPIVPPVVFTPNTPTGISELAFSNTNGIGIKSTVISNADTLFVKVRLKKQNAFFPITDIIDSIIYVHINTLQQGTMNTYILYSHFPEGAAMGTYMVETEVKDLYNNPLWLNQLTVYVGTSGIEEFQGSKQATGKLTIYTMSGSVVVTAESKAWYLNEISSLMNGLPAGIYVYTIGDTVRKQILHQN